MSVYLILPFNQGEVFTALAIVDKQGQEGCHCLGNLCAQYCPMLDVEVTRDCVKFFPHKSIVSQSVGPVSSGKCSSQHLLSYI